MSVPIVNKPLSNKITDERRDLMMRVMDGDSELVGVMHVLHHYKYCDNFLIWMICHKYTGKNLREIVIKRFKSNVAALVEYMVEAMRGVDSRQIPRNPDGS